MKLPQDDDYVKIQVEPRVQMKDATESPYTSPHTVTALIALTVPPGAVVFSAEAQVGDLHVGVENNEGTLVGYELVKAGNRIEIGCAGLTEIYVEPDDTSATYSFHFKML